MRASESMTSEPMTSEPVTSEPMTLEPMTSNPMPATLRVPWHDAYEEQHHQYDDDPHRLLPCSHGNHLSLRVHRLVLFENKF